MGRVDKKSILARCPTNYRTIMSIIPHMYNHGRLSPYQNLPHWRETSYLGRKPPQNHTHVTCKLTSHPPRRDCWGTQRIEGLEDILIALPSTTSSGIWLLQMTGLLMQYYLNWSYKRYVVPQVFGPVVWIGWWRPTAIVDPTISLLSGNSNFVYIFTHLEESRTARGKSSNNAHMYE